MITVHLHPNNKLTAQLSYESESEFFCTKRKVSNWKGRPDVRVEPHSFHLGSLWFEKTIWSLWLTTVSTQYMYNVLKGETRFPSEKWICAAPDCAACRSSFLQDAEQREVCAYRKSWILFFHLIILSFLTQHLFCCFSALCEGITS